MSGQSVSFEDVPVPLLDLRGTTVAGATGAAHSLLARATSDLVGADLLDLVLPEYRAAVVGLLGDQPDQPDRARELEVRIAPAPGRPVRLWRSAAPDRVLVGLEDLQAERRLAAVIDAVADSTLLLDPDGQLVWQSDALAARVPTGPDNVGSHPVERLHPEDLPLVLDSFTELASRPGGRVSRVVRSRAVEQDDVWQLIELIGAGRADDPDLGGVVVQVRNLDEGDELESIGHTEGPLMSLAEAAPIGILLMDRLDRVVFANRSSRELLGYAPSDDLSSWRDRVAASHHDAVDDLVTQGLDGAAAVTITAPVALVDGSASWLRIRVAPHVGAQQRVVGVIVALEDVTAEVEARASSERLMHMLDATSDFVCIFRPSGEVLHTNAALRQVLDRLRDEGGSGGLGDLMRGEQRDRFLETAVTVVEQSDTWQGELEIHVGGGATLQVSALGVVRRSDDGEIDWIAMVARDISGLKQAEANLRRMATLDHLTGVANRALLTEQLEAVVARSATTGRPVAVLFCDLDRFKEVNDERGHAVGDTVLVTVADRLQEMTRGTDMAARVGGDEFVVLCEGVTSVDSLATLAERIIASVRRPIEVGPDEDPVQVGISIGVALARQTPYDGDRLLISADQAMYRAKATGGNRYRIHVIDGT